MSKDHWEFREENGEIGFLAGIIDALSDKLELICKWGYALDADIFPFANNDISKLTDVVKERIKHYDLPSSWHSPIENLNMMDFHLEKVDCETSQYFYEVMSKFSTADDLLQRIREFLDDICWHIGDPVCVYAPVRSNEMSDDNLTVIGRVYLYMAFEYFFIQYKEYAAGFCSLL